MFLNSTILKTFFFTLFAKAFVDFMHKIVKKHKNTVFVIKRVVGSRISVNFPSEGIKKGFLHSCKMKYSPETTNKNGAGF